MEKRTREEYGKLRFRKNKNQIEQATEKEKYRKRKRRKEIEGLIKRAKKDRGGRTERYMDS